MAPSPLLALFLFCCLSLVLFPFAVAHPAAFPEDGSPPGHTIEQDGITHRVCGTEQAVGSVVDAHKDLRALHKTKPDHRVMPRGHLVHEGDLWDVVEEEKRSNLQGRKASGGNGIVIETYAHFVTSKAMKKALSPEAIAGMIAEQGNVLNSAYSDLNISFHLHPHTFSVNDAWATDSDSAGMKKSLRKGTYSALNLYFQTNLSAPSGAPAGAAAGSSGGGAQAILGYCTLPTSVSYTPSTCNAASKGGSGCAPQSKPPTSYEQDGCSILASTLPKGSLRDYNMGRTAVHESGHWFGLLHTFQDESCSSSSSGDFVEDTPQESIPTSGCPVGKNSCPKRSNPSGVKMYGGGQGDAIGNYMDYSNDGCYTGFSPLQQARVLNMWHVFRSGN